MVSCNQVSVKKPKSGFTFNITDCNSSILDANDCVFASKMFFFFLFFFFINFIGILLSYKSNKREVTRTKKKKKKKKKKNCQKGVTNGTWVPMQGNSLQNKK